MVVDSDEELRDILRQEVVAVVGCSTTRGKDAHEIPRYLQAQGYEIIPINPFADEILGERAYDSVQDVDASIDIVDIFRPSEEVAGIVDEVLAREDVDTIWMQRGIRDDEAADRGEHAGLRVVQDRCMKVEHRRLDP